MKFRMLKLAIPSFVWNIHGEQLDIDITWYSGDILRYIYMSENGVCIPTSDDILVYSDGEK